MPNQDIGKYPWTRTQNNTLRSSPNGASTGIQERPWVSGDDFCKRTDQALAGIPVLFKLVDDILIQGRTKKELIDRVKDVFRRCLENQITLSNSKHQVGQNVKFAGHVITDQGNKPNPDTVAAINDYPEPDNLMDLQSFMGLANQFGEYSPDLRNAIETPLLNIQITLDGLAPNKTTNFLNL